MTNFYICFVEQNIFRTLSFRTQSRNGMIYLSLEFCKSVLYEVFKNSLLKFIRPSANSFSNVSDSLGIKLLTRLTLGMSHLREHKFNLNFQDTENPLCSCSLESESTAIFSALPKLYGPS